jgi:hypothetical protein
MRKILFICFFIAASCTKSIKTEPLTSFGKSERSALGINSRFLEGRMRLHNFFNTYDIAVLNRLRNVEFDSVCLFSAGVEVTPDLEYMYTKNAELISILNQINPIVYSSHEMRQNDEMVLYAGIIELYGELATSGGSSIRTSFPWRCILDVLGGVFTLRDLISSYKALIVNGAQWSTIRVFLLQQLKRYGGWAMAIGVIYDVTTECL